MADWILALLVGFSGGGLIGYFGRGWIDEHFTRRKEARQFKHQDLQALRDDLLWFLGEPKAHFDWLENVPDIWAAGGSPTPDEKVAIIAGWVYKNAHRHPPERRGPMYLVLHVAYQLARGDRHFLEKNPRGDEQIHDAWDKLDKYAQELTRQLRGEK